MTAVPSSAKMPGPPPPYGGDLMEAPPGSINRQFPAEFSIYGAGAFSRDCILGPHQNEPLYYVSGHTGWSGKPDVILHNGKTESAPPLASVTLHKWGGGMDVDLPPAQAGGSTREAVTSHGWLSKSYVFSIEVDGPKGPRREEFAWTHGSWSEVSRLGGSLTGWRLTRSSTGEAVALCARVGMSMSKRFTFEFLGSGGAGVLGERFAVMAVITAIGLYVRARRKNNAAATSAAAA
ncbi:hypothetical protein GQ53DRAFT_356522 [Thozetella sp. PMI_491]|nr:hypothetical protein GQ53DRAFT_356522 [Thozetella sp. PMI_491]